MHPQQASSSRLWSQGTPFLPFTTARNSPDSLLVASTHIATGHRRWTPDSKVCSLGRTVHLLPYSCNRPDRRPGWHRCDFVRHMQQQHQGPGNEREEGDACLSLLIPLFFPAPLPQCQDPQYPPQHQQYPTLIFPLS